MAYNQKISLNINVDNIQKSALYKGEKGTYLRLTVIPTPDNQWNDYMCTQYMGKGTDDVILGNGRDLVFNDNNSGNNTSGQAPTGPAAPSNSNEDGLPF